MNILEAFSSKLRAISKLPDLRRKIVYTLMMFLVARVGAHIPSPGVDIEKLGSLVNTNDILGFVNMFSGGAFQKVSIFSLGVMPYINASIVMSLLTVIIPQLEEIQKEGDSGRQKIIQYTRYGTIVIGMIQAFGISVWLQSSGLVENPGFLFTFTTCTILTAGTVFLMWLGEQITINGIGNGISLIIFIGIVDRLPSSTIQLFQKMSGDKFFIVELAVIVAVAVFIIAGIVLFQLGQRKIPIQYAGKGFGGKNSIASKTYLPLKINLSGVIPLIFANVVMMLPAMLVKAIPGSSDFKTFLESLFSFSHPFYMICSVALVVFFTFFYTALMFDPVKVAENLKKSGGTIPGIRPGKETVDYLENVVTRITVVGAIFLAVIDLIPMLALGVMKLPFGMGGTSILIVVGVALDLIQQINVHLATREYEGFI